MTGNRFIRLMLCANNLDLEGSIATSNLGQGQQVRSEPVQKMVEEYGKLQPNLFLYDKNYPPAYRLASLIKSGQPVSGPQMPVSQ